MSKIPLCVDLDGTLLLTDTLVESLLVALTDDRWLVLRVPFWLLRGRAYLKHKLAQNIELDVSSLPLNQEFLDYLKDQHRAGRQLILVTAADIKVAREVASRVGLFDEVIASDGMTNLAGRHKAEALEKRFGRGGFDYAGNEYRDLAIWSVARNAIVVSDKPGLAQKTAAACHLERTFSVPPATVRDWNKALRVHQWTKNVLLFIPMLGAHAWGDIAKVKVIMIAFFCFCLGASSVYLFNDLVDLESDRHHGSKHRRPFASGRIALSKGLAVAVTLLAVAALVAGLTLPASFCMLFAGYYALTLFYSHRLKRIELMDVFVLASLYCVRILAGGRAIDVPVSRWLLAFSLFFFLSLAFAKRFTELRALASSKVLKLKGRGYQLVDLELIGNMGIASGYIAVLVLAFYTNSPEVTTLYHHPGLLWAACVVMLYWISRIWLLAHRGLLHDDPVVFALTDRQSWLAGMALVLVGVAAMPK